MNTERLAYVAGLIDGEGCLTIRRYQRQYQAYLIVANNHPVLLEYVRETIGGRIYSVSRVKPHLQLHLQGAELARALRQLLPYLIGKKAEAELTLAFLDRPARAEWKISDAELASMADYCERLSQLKGPRRKGRPRSIGS